MNPLDLLAETGRCVACGLCLPYCPTYRKTESETDSPRGRILLTQAVLQGNIPLNQRYMKHIDLCLTCRACENACPNHVKYGLIVDGARAMINKERPSGLLHRLAMTLVASPKLLRFTGSILRCGWLLGIKKLIPRFPLIPRQYQWKTRYAVPQARGEVCLFLGCASSVLDGDTLAATIYILNRLGYTVHIPSGQTCCGGLHQHAGESSTFLNKRNIQVFSAYVDMPMLAIATGCGTRLLELMPDSFQDIVAFLAKAEGWADIDIKPLKAKVSVHEPCSIRNVLKSESSLYSLLKHIPEAQVTPLAGNAQCCGGAGSYMLTQPEMAQKLRDDKISLIEKSAPDYLATSNIGCALHIAGNNGLNHVEIIHPVLLLARQMGFTS